MNPGSGRQRVTELFEAALGQAASERNDFLRRACDGDDALLAEVKSLIAEFERLGESGQATLPAGLPDRRERSVASTDNLKQIGRYAVVRELGHGAMGIVFEARDPLIGRTVAIKTIRLDEFGGASEEKWLQERLFREARSAGALSHPGIVTIHDLGVHEDLAFIAMEYVDGPTLESILTGQTLDYTKVIDILRQAATALDYANEAGVVHRDVKPGNIMLHKARTVKITDFGIAKITTTQQLTRTGTVMGTPSYMSPEQIRALPVDGRSDQFSLGVVAFEMLTGVKPFRADSLATLVHQIVYEDRPSARAVNDLLCEAVDNVFYRALAKEPDERFPNCGAMIEDLAEALRRAAIELEERRRQEERKRKFESGTQEIEGLLASDDWQGAESRLNALCGDYAGDVRLVVLADRIERARQDARNRERIQEGIREVTTNLARKKFDEALEILNAIDSECPGAPQVEQLREAVALAREAEREEQARREYAAGLRRAIERAHELLRRNFVEDAERFLESQRARYGEEKDFDVAFAAVIQAKELKRLRTAEPPVSSALESEAAPATIEAVEASSHSPVPETIVEFGEKPPKRAEPRMALFLGAGAAATILLAFLAYFAFAPSAAPPTVFTFKASPGAGGARLSWDVQNATEITIQPEIGKVHDTGSIDVHPQSSTKYTLTANGPGGVVQSEVLLKVEQKSGDSVVPASAPETSKTADAPDIHLTASPESVKPGGAATLRWRVTGSRHVVLDPGNRKVPAESSLRVHPSITTTYTLTATTLTTKGQATATVSVPSPSQARVESPPVSQESEMAIQFMASSTVIKAGGSTELSWQVDGASHISINPEVGSVPSAGSSQVSPSKTTTYTLTARSATSTRQKRVTVEVRQAPQEGRIVWTGRLGPGDVLRLNAGTASLGSLLGQLPGIPIDLEVHPALQVLERPQPANNWKGAVIRNDGSESEAMIVLRWKSR